MSQREEIEWRRAREARGNEEPGEKLLGTLGKLIRKTLKHLKSIVNLKKKNTCSEIISPWPPSHFFSLFKFLIYLLILVYDIRVYACVCKW